MGDGFTTTQEDPLNHTYPTWGDYEITLQASSPNCIDSVSHSIHILPGPPVADIDTVIPGCEPWTVAFVNNSNYGYEFYWAFGDGNTSTDYEPTHTYTDAGI
jgi:PKD repeat protein